jgi:energy-coupling factor transporter ATP-binding protein EcfA2
VSVWEAYPDDYRHQEVESILQWVCSGSCVAIIGLSGSGKSNLAGFIANRCETLPVCPRFILIDCNLLAESSSLGLFRFISRSLFGSDFPIPATKSEALFVLENGLRNELSLGKEVCIIFDRFDALYEWKDFEVLASNLRAIRDLFKYQLSFIIAARKPVKDATELAELFFGHTLWLGPLTKQDALWSARRDLDRLNMEESLRWDESDLEKIVDISWGYPSILRAVCEAFAGGEQLDVDLLKNHPAILHLANEFWSDDPDAGLLEMTGIQGHPLLVSNRLGKRDFQGIVSSQLTAKENLLLEYLKDHIGEVCEKDAIIQAVWPEDVIFERGVRDESLAQLVRRLRVKIEADPASPHFIQTIPGRGYFFRPS